MPHHMIWHSMDGEGDRDILKYYRNYPDIRFRTADKCSCTSKLKLNRDDESDRLPEAVPNIEPEITKNCQTKVSNGQKNLCNLCKNHDSSMRAGAVVEMEINLSKCITFVAVLIGHRPMKTMFY